MHFSIMKVVPGIILTGVLLSGCTGNGPERLPVITAFHPDGTGGGIVPPESAGESTGYVLSYAAGDEVLFSFTLDSEVMTVKEPMDFIVVLRRPLRIAVDDTGMLFSIDGAPWQPMLDAFEGGLQSGLSIEQQDRVNRGQVTVTANER